MVLQSNYTMDLQSQTNLDDLPIDCIELIFEHTTLREAAGLALASKRYAKVQRERKAIMAIPNRENCTLEEPRVYHVGVQPGESLIAAILRCPTNGSVLLHAGTHIISAPMHIPVFKNVRLFGRGQATIEWVAPPHITQYGGLIHTTSTVVLHGIRLRSNIGTLGVIATNGSLHVQNCDIQVRGTAIVVNGPVRTYINNTTLRGKRGLQLCFGLNEVWIEGNHIQSHWPTPMASDVANTDITAITAAIQWAGIVMRYMKPVHIIRNNTVQGFGVGVLYDVECPMVYDLPLTNRFIDNVVDEEDNRDPLNARG